MIEDQEEWLPAKDAVRQLSLLYHSEMGDSFADARSAAIKAIVFNLIQKNCEARALRWGVYFQRASGRTISSDSKKHGMQVPGGLWRYLETAHDKHVDWVAGDFFGNANTSWKITPTVTVVALKVELKRGTLPVIGGDLGSTLEGFSQQNKRKISGRPRKWNWDGAMCAVIAKANSLDGLPERHGAQAEIGRMLSQWFLENQGGEPVASEIGLKAAMIMSAVAHDRK